ncbi:MAG: hypothetical protein V5A38_07555 [Halolamina sp.]|uniref:DUF7285 family protein n=1 Tax=Halolamina sp. TaxID=1940283 RepID=UPI002FC3A264
MATASRSSAPERRAGHSSAATTERGSHERGTGETRAQVSPTAALVAVVAIGIGLSLHVTVLASVAPTPDQNVAGPTLDRVHDATTSAGVTDPDRLGGAVGAAPDGYELKITLRGDNRSWTVGPTPPGQAESGDYSNPETATRRVAVRTEPGTVAAGYLQVVIWR